jgi:hypothetical protein
VFVSLAVLLGFVQKFMRAVVSGRLLLESPFPFPTVLQGHHLFESDWRKYVILDCNHYFFLAGP